MPEEEGDEEMTTDKYFENMSDEQFMKETNKLVAKQTAKNRLRQEIDKMGMLSQKDKAFK